MLYTQCFVVRAFHSIWMMFSCGLFMRCIRHFAHSYGIEVELRVRATHIERKLAKQFTHTTGLIKFNPKDYNTVWTLHQFNDNVNEALSLLWLTKQQESHVFYCLALHLCILLLPPWIQQKQWKHRKNLCY